MEDLYYLNDFTVTDFPANSVGLRFTFQVSVFTDFAIAGVSSSKSISMILGDRPDKPSSAPQRNAQTSESVISVTILPVPGIHGSAITTYVVEIDDGKGGLFTELQSSLNLVAVKMSGVQRGLNYRLRYKALNEIGYSPYSDIAYVQAASVPQVPAEMSVSMNGSQVVFKWNLPFNRASLIEIAEIVVKTSAGTFEPVSQCDGAQ